MKCKLCEALQIKEKENQPLQRGEAARGLAPIVLPFGFSNQLNFVKSRRKLGEGKRMVSAEGEGGLPAFLPFQSSGERGWAGVAWVRCPQ